MWAALPVRHWRSLRCDSFRPYRIFHQELRLAVAEHAGKLSPAGGGPAGATGPTIHVSRCILGDTPLPYDIAASRTVGQRRSTGSEPKSV
jgi:hypothetical protein